ncbi:MAG: hypothetical protein Q7R79_02535 [bacterium]|nr:hypothetical protein [bacterium]
MNPQKVTTILVTALVSILVTSLGLSFAFTLVRDKNAPVESSKGVEAPTPSLVREIINVGYVIGDRLFFSPALGLMFSGQLKNLTFINNEFRATDWPGVIEVFSKKSDQNVIDAIKEVVKNEQKNPDDCEFEMNESDGVAAVSVKPKASAVPTENELFSRIKKDHPEIQTLKVYRAFCETTPECELVQDSLAQVRNEKYCSRYAVSNAYHDRSNFLFSTRDAGSDTFVYAHSEVGGGDMSWFDYVHLLPK